MNASDAVENLLIDHVFRDTQWTKPAALYIALCTSAPTDSDTGSTIVEPVGNNYSRVAYNPSASSNWEATQGGVSGASSGTGGQTSNNGAITFAAASGSWGSITHIAIVSASTAGTMYFWGELSVAKTITSGDIFSFQANQLTVTIA